MKKCILILLIVVGIIMSAAGCSQKEKINVTTTLDIYNLTDGSIRTITEPYSIRGVSWSPDSNYFDYQNFDSKVPGNVKIRQINDLKVIENPIDIKEYYGCSVLPNWNSESNMVVEAKGKGDVWFKPGTNVLYPASEADKKGSDAIPELTEEQIKNIRDKLGIPDNLAISINDSRTKLYYFTLNNEAVCYDIESGEKEATFQAIEPMMWIYNSNKLIYSIPKAGFQSIKEIGNHKTNLFETYVYDLDSKKTIKVADFYTLPFCSPDGKYIIMFPDDYNNDFRI